MAEKLDRFRRMAGGPNPNKRVTVLEKAVEQILEDDETTADSITPVYYQIYTASENRGLSPLDITWITEQFNSTDFTLGTTNITYNSAPTIKVMITFNASYSGTIATSAVKTEIKKNGVTVGKKEWQPAHTAKGTVTLANIITELTTADYISVYFSNTAGVVSLTDIYLTIVKI